LRKLRVAREHAAQFHDTVQPIGQTRLEFAAHPG
jgi:hypothetical protein